MVKLPATPSTKELPLDALISRGKLIKQGAEAKVYISTLEYPLDFKINNSKDLYVPTESIFPVILKYRPPKKYRHPTLDAQLTTSRTLTEVRSLARCAAAGVSVPRVIVWDSARGSIVMEKIEGVVGGWCWGYEDSEQTLTPSAHFEEGEHGPQTIEDIEAVLAMKSELNSRRVSTAGILERTGQAIAKMHLAGVIHGDLTTLNIIVRLSGKDVEIVLIDFGLSQGATDVENRAVDLYVLERAITSVFPSKTLIRDGTKVGYNEVLLKGYFAELKKAGGERDADAVNKRLELVRMRGRKRSMVG